MIKQLILLSFYFAQYVSGPSSSLTDDRLHIKVARYALDAATVLWLTWYVSPYWRWSKMAQNVVFVEKFEGRSTKLQYWKLYFSRKIEMFFFKMKFEGCRCPHFWVSSFIFSHLVIISGDNLKPKGTCDLSCYFKLSMKLLNHSPTLLPCYQIFCINRKNWIVLLSHSSRTEIAKNKTNWH